LAVEMKNWEPRLLLWLHWHQASQAVLLEPSAVSLCQLLSPWLAEGLSLWLQSLEVEHLAGV